MSAVRDALVTLSKRDIREVVDIGQREMFLRNMQELPELCVETLCLLSGVEYGRGPDERGRIGLDLIEWAYLEEEEWTTE